VKGLRKAYRGERGFTLVELLVVIVILGVLAAVATLAVTRFMGSGNLESAKTELHQAQTAVVACMADAGVATLTTTSTTWNGSSGVITAVVGTPPVTYDAATYLMGSAFKAVYTVSTNGEITAGSLTGTLIGTTKPWSGISWSASGKTWVKP
jgi:general secretion pathway protein G